MSLSPLTPPPPPPPPPPAHTQTPGLPTASLRATIPVGIHCCSAHTALKRPRGSSTDSCARHTSGYSTHNTLMQCECVCVLSNHMGVYHVCAHSTVLLHHGHGPPTPPANTPHNHPPLPARPNTPIRRAQPATDNHTMWQLCCNGSSLAALVQAASQHHMREMRTACCPAYTDCITQTHTSATQGIG
jgi:hypothetical protein